MSQEANVFVDHRIAEAYGVDPERLNQKESFEEEIKEFIEHDLGLSFLGHLIYQFNPTPENPGNGLTDLTIIGQSHVAVHTWPEYGRLRFSIESCSREPSLDRLDGAIISRYQPSQLHTTIVDTSIPGRDTTIKRYYIPTDPTTLKYAVSEIEIVSSLPEMMNPEDLAQYIKNGVVVGFSSFFRQYNYSLCDITETL